MNKKEEGKKGDLSILKGDDQTYEIQEKKYHNRIK